MGRLRPDRQHRRQRLRRDRLGVGLPNLALKGDGSLIAWGDNDFGQCNVPAGNNYVAVGAGLYHGLALRSDGSLVGWGRNSEGQCNVPAGNDFIKVAAGWDPRPGLRSDVSLAAWETTPSANATPPPATACSRGRLPAWPSRATVPWPPGVITATARPPRFDGDFVAGRSEQQRGLEERRLLAGWGDITTMGVRRPRRQQLPDDSRGQEPRPQRCAAS